MRSARVPWPVKAATETKRRATVRETIAKGGAATGRTRARADVDELFEQALPSDGRQPSFELKKTGGGCRRGVGIAVGGDRSRRVSLSRRFLEIVLGEPSPTSEVGLICDEQRCLCNVGACSLSRPCPR